MKETRRKNKKLSILIAIIVSFLICLGTYLGLKKGGNADESVRPGGPFNGYFSGFGYQVVQEFERTPEDHMVGLLNHGQTCFGISMIQFLYHSEDFKAALTGYLEIPDYPDRNVDHFTTARELQTIFTQLDNASNFTWVEPIRYGAFPPRLRQNLQFDTSEVLNYYNTFEGFDWTNFSIIQRILIQYNDNEPFDDPENRDVCDPILSVTFQDQNQPISISQLIQNRYALNLRGLGNQEILDDIHTAATQFKIKTLPNNIIIQANRFYSDANGVRSKNVSKIIIDETVDFAPYLLEQTETITTYELVSFIVHEGSTLGRGHYYSIFKRSDGSWVKINNSRCSRIGHAEMVKEAEDGYLFMYRKN